MPRLNFGGSEEASGLAAVLLGHMGRNTPVILTGLDRARLIPDPFDSWFKEAGGHTVVHIPPKYKEAYGTQWRWPKRLQSVLEFLPDAAWGGKPGFFEDAEGGGPLCVTLCEPNHV